MGEDIKALIRRHFPEVAATTLRELPHTGWGGDSDAYLVDGALVFRFPRRPEVRTSLAVEACLLPRLAPRVGLPIPAFRYVASDPKENDAPPLFVGYPVIEGERLTPQRFARVDASAAKRIAAQLGAFLTGLHTFPVGEAVACGAEAPRTTVREAVERQYAEVRDRVYPELAAEERAYLDRLYAVYLSDERHFLQPPVVRHGDLTSDHILLDVDGAALAGIIDFGDVGIGDAAGDFVWRFEYGEEFFRRVLASYGAPLTDPEAFAQVVEFRYRMMAAGEIAYGLETGNAAYVAEGRSLLREQVDTFRLDSASYGSG